MLPHVCRSSESHIGFPSFNGSETDFKAAYPCYVNGNSELYVAINDARKARGDRISRK